MLSVDGAGRHLLRDGRPFFMLADTAWALLQDLSMDQARRYVDDRVARGFTTIQCVAVFWGNHQPNAAGETPFVAKDLGRPNEAYFRHVDRVLGYIEQKGLTVNLLPIWFGEYAGVLSPSTARAYGEFLGARYKARRDIVWVLGGDTGAESGSVQGITRELARGIARGVNGAPDDYSGLMMTYHPGYGTSATWFHQDPWLTMNMYQSGHGYFGDRNEPKSHTLARDSYQKEPAKPVVNGEPPYEGIAINFNDDRKGSRGPFDAADVRHHGYWSVFAGSCGHVYGHNSIWQFAGGRRDSPFKWSWTVGWEAALDAPGASQMRYLRRLMESRPLLEGIPLRQAAPDLVVSREEPGTGDHVEWYGGRDGERHIWVLVYLPSGRPVAVDLAKMAGSKVRAWWYDPRNGKATLLGEYDRKGPKEFTPPGTAGDRTNDWVLVLDDASRNYGPPGE